MKKHLRSLPALLIAVLLLCCVAFADTGPKPSASFTFTGMPDEDYYVTMLSRVDTYGPHRVHQPGSEIPGYVLEQGEQDPAYPAWQKFVDYKDPDGYYFLEDLFELCHGDDEAGWRYFPPEQFKLLLYFPESDTFLCSTVTERYAFDSVYRLDLSGKSPTEIAALTLTDPNGDPIPADGTGETSAVGEVTLDKADGTRQQDRIPHNFSSSRSISGSIIAHFRGDCNFILAGRERLAFVNLHGAAHLSGRCCMYIHQIPINSG